ncbi:hypothetical protein QP028_15130 [Corynebacterium suedekumii]|nr:hypothetical protein QP028_15130 [Corynebacterium suedekumii]
MTQSTILPIPDTPVAPVTPERLAELLEAEGLQYRLESAPSPTVRRPPSWSVPVSSTPPSPSASTATASSATRCGAAR